MQSSLKMLDHNPEEIFPSSRVAICWWISCVFSPTQSSRKLKKRNAEWILDVENNRHNLHKKDSFQQAHKSITLVNREQVYFVGQIMHGTGHWVMSTSIHFPVRRARRPCSNLCRLKRDRGRYSAETHLPDRDAVLLSRRMHLHFLPRTNDPLLLLFSISQTVFVRPPYLLFYENGGDSCITWTTTAINTETTEWLSRREWKYMIPVASETQYSIFSKFITERQNRNQISVIFHFNTANALETTERFSFWNIHCIVPLHSVTDMPFLKSWVSNQYPINFIFATIALHPEEELSKTNGYAEIDSRNL
jgi:hypothetical protein